LRADGIGVDQGDLIVRRAGGEHLLARRDDADAIGRGREVEDDLGAGIAAPTDGAVGGPGVLTDLHRDASEIELEEIVTQGHAVDIELEARTATGEGALLVEDLVGGQLLFGHIAQDLAAMDHGAAVVELAPDRDRDTDREDGAEVPGLLGEAIQLFLLRRDIGAPLNEVLRRIAAHHLFWKTGQGDVLRSHGGGHLQEPIRIGAHRTNGGVDIGDRDLDQSHLVFNLRPVPSCSQSLELASRHGKLLLVDVEMTAVPQGLAAEEQQDLG
jgi:hypothetical protein